VIAVTVWRYLRIIRDHLSLAPRGARSMTLEFLTLIGIGFLAQLVDGALGMAFGLISTIALLSLGIPPAQASAAVHTAEVATTGNLTVAPCRYLTRLPRPIRLREDLRIRHGHVIVTHSGRIVWPLC
jgi:hypothetical protein